MLLHLLPLGFIHKATSLPPTTSPSDPCNLLSSLVHCSKFLLIDPPSGIAHQNITIISIFSHCNTITSQNGMVPEAQLEAGLSPGNLPHGVADRRGIVQPQPSSMLQGQELQGASEGEGGTGADGARRSGEGAPGRGGGRGGGGGGGMAVAESETSFPFPSTDLPHVVQSPSPFFHEGPGAPQESPSCLPRRRSGGQLEAESAGVIRSGVGRRPAPPSRASTIEALARTSWADLNAPLPTPDSVEKYRTIRRASTTAHLLTLLSSNPAPSLPSIPSPIQLIPEANLRAETPLATSTSDISQHSQSSVSTAASNASAASSVAYHMRHGLPDLRLFRQKSKPAQHAIQNPSILKVAGDFKRSPTSFKPKVVSDTAIMVTGKVSRHPPALPNPVTHTFPEMMRQDSIITQPLCRVQTLALPIHRKPLPPLPTDKEDPQDAHRNRPSTAAKDFAAVPSTAPPDHVTRQLRFGSPARSARRDEESPPPSAETSRKSSAERSRRSSTSGQHRHHRRRKHYHAVTPPEGEPHVRPLHHGDSYFQTFHTLPDEVSREFVPVQTPRPRKEDTLRRRPESDPVPVSNARPPASAAHRKTSSETAAVALLKNGKQGGMFSFFRKSAFGDQVVTESRDGATPSPVPTVTLPTPAIMLNGPGERSTKRRLSSVVPEMQVQSYFDRPRVRRLPSDNSLSPMGLPTPLSVISDEPLTRATVRERARQHNRSSSEQLSPLGSPRTRHRPTLESLRSRVSQSTIKTAAAPQTEVRRAPTNMSDNRSSAKSTLKGKRKGSVKFVDEVVPARIEPFLLERSQVPLKSKPSNYFVDIRKVSSTEQLQSGSRLPAETRRTQRWSLVPKLSLASLPKLPSLTSEKLRHMSSQLSRSTAQDSRSGEVVSDSELETSSPADPKFKGRIQPSIPVGQRFTAAQLEVTEFEQTPYSQRYHDSERALKQQIRALVDEGLNEGDDAEGDEELVLGFEHDVPDHYPNSPLCPLNPMHKSGGKAICPLHGRYKKGVPPVTALAGKRPIGRVSSSAMEQHVGHHRIEIVLDTAVDEEEPKIKDGGLPTTVDIFGVLKEDPHILTKTSILGIDGAVSMRSRGRTVSSMHSEPCRGRTRERDRYGSERKRRRRVRMQQRG